MIKATRNQLANIKNPYQGSALKVLCVCSAGLLRSPTLAHTLNVHLKLNTRACGTSEEFALIPLSEALVKWADQIVFVNNDNYTEAFNMGYEEMLNVKNVIVLDIPDSYDYCDSTLVQICLEQYLEKSL